MMVFDASTLILITKIEILETFLDHYELEVAIPTAVEHECCGGRKTLDSLTIRKALDERRIKVRKVKNPQTITALENDFSLGRGEAEAIALAMQQKAKLIGIDDKSGMNGCRLSGVPFTTALAILVRSREKGLLSLEQARTRLSALAGYGRYKKTMVEAANRRLEDHA